MNADARRAPLRQVQALRQAIKDSTLYLPKQDLRAVLDLMENLRLRRLAAMGSPLPDPLPAEMARGEIYREIKWRLGTLPPEEAEAVARLVIQIARRASRHPARAASKRAGTGGPVATALIAVMEHLLKQSARG